MPPNYGICAAKPSSLAGPTERTETSDQTESNHEPDRVRHFPAPTNNCASPTEAVPRPRDVVQRVAPLGRLVAGRSIASRLLLNQLIRTRATRAQRVKT